MMLLIGICFNPLWINTALKRGSRVEEVFLVSIPYGLTLLSNNCCHHLIPTTVSIPYGLTLLSNDIAGRSNNGLVSIPYGLTLLSNNGNSPPGLSWFQSPMD